MNLTVDPSLRTLNDCGCCEGITVETPVQVTNRPGLTAVAYRVGLHAQFKATLLARLSGSRQPALSTLTMRVNDDFVIALLDAWATVADVLTFYQERIANEAYLRTATERLSVLELARLIDYQLRPGVAASAYLAFTLEDTPGALGQALSIGTTAQLAPEPLPPITIDIGTKVQSIPGPGEQAQTFETVEKTEARVEWNAIKPRLTQPQKLLASMQIVILQGTATNLKQGDTLLIVDKAGHRTPETILNITVDNEAQTTRVDFVSPQSPLPSYARPTGLQKGTLDSFPTRVELTESVVQDIINKTWSEEDLAALAKMQGWSVQALIANITRQTAQPTLDPDTGVFALRQHAAVFGHNAPKWDALPTDLRFNKRIEQYNPDGTVKRKADGRTIDYLIVPAAFPTPGWENRTLEADAEPRGGERSIYLDSTYPSIIKDSWLALVSPSVPAAVFKVKDNVETPRSGFAISAKVSRLRVEASAPFSSDFKMRTTTVLAQSERLALADLPIEDLVQDSSLTLDRTYLGLKVGQKVILTGKRSDLKGVTASEMMALKEVTIEAGFTVLTFEQSLAYSYERKSVTINANVALATHGETVQEVLGGGDASQPFQRFTLRQPPLTYVGAATPSGAQTTLEVRVNDLLWHEVPSLFEQGAEERVYVTHLEDDGKTTVLFGDGKKGARLPTGQENVQAKYRKGIGLPGLVKADQLTQLLTRPLGVKGVTNPLAASGAEDREKLDQARRNAPLTVLTLGRIVSLQDYEDFARAFSGIDKALATWTWSGERRGVFVTIAGAKGAEVKTDSPLYENLLKAMREAGDPTVPLVVQSYQSRLFRLSAAVQVDPDYVPEKVLAEVERKLRDSFSFEARAFGQPVNLSEVIAVIHSVRGVVAVDVNEFYRVDHPEPPKPRLAAAVPRPGAEKVFPAELLTLDPRPLGLEVLP
jgi:predicted phage baseplate assembly protein